MKNLFLSVILFACGQYLFANEPIVAKLENRSVTIHTIEALNNGLYTLSYSYNGGRTAAIVYQGYNELESAVSESTISHFLDSAEESVQNENEIHTLSQLFNGVID
ncbi:hypothetical protein [Flammeovirga kamogawensis]|uniref:DUF4907 domain-containing protein n=1 Tax=Flammeovirga kamogawensis TaxID=373891 RepID=A0ABX8H431_9BACT|nr:hypothetical protein [Flammeovirga kamogawensis]MBB6463501.1 hypothetical protein [Flammeovirga kamogawensis]QWG10560.1 hypothetical protein KM029_24565 [Flammeovirga kamogawensis]TRX63668.1 hypothetical protein EO216_24960 [Flammeovirga kamogawensis]